MVYLLFSVFVSGQNPCDEKDPLDRVIHLSTTTTEYPPAISFKWNPIPGHFDIEIFRKSKSSNSWGSAIAVLPSSSDEFTDENVEIGVEYEYAIKAKYCIPIEIYISAGIKCKETEYRGKIIFLVDSTFTNVLKNELIQFESDLIGDGWEVIRRDISQNKSVGDVKNLIRNIYNSDPINVNTVFLFGHIPVPYSGHFAFDGHYGEHEGAWPADLYYGDMNEKIWTDEYVNSTQAIHASNRNIPGDGKFDINELPKDEIISLSIGRVDFHDLPAFPQSETELLRNYLIKNHAFRHKLINPKLQALIDDNFGVLKYQGITEIFSISGWRNFSALLNSENVKTGDFFPDTENDSYIWSYGCGGGTLTSSKGIGMTEDFVNQSPKTIFTAFYGSWFGDWNTQNNFMRSALASKGWTLTSCWAGRPHYTFHQMGMGETVGHCVRETQNNLNLYYTGRTNRGIHENLQGDPTLRMHIVNPINSLQTDITEYNTVLLLWNSSGDNILGYYIYKLDTLTNIFKRITPSPIENTEFEDVSPMPGNNFYMVRALQLSKVTSGSYYNLSQGIFDTIQFIHEKPVTFDIDFADVEVLRYTAFKNMIDSQTSQLTETIEPGHEIAEDFLVYPNPSSGLYNINFGSNPINSAELKIYNLKGQLIQLEEFHKTTKGSFDIGKFPKGIYFVKGIIDDKKWNIKIFLQ